MVYKTWSYHFSKNWHFYAIIGVLVVGLGILAHKVYSLNKSMGRKKKRREETRDAYSKHSRDYSDVEAGGEFEMVDDAEPLEAEQSERKEKKDEEFEVEVIVEPTKEAERVEQTEKPEVVDEKKYVDEEKTVPTCSAKISSGKRKGEICGRIAVPDTQLCRIHS